ncbi:MAG: ribbon-helix-helix protein, CopG family [Armatimonadetes bacterium]|nr:ribbon-helix-helix protein, CopG family [Armatimonadota bacterium]
MHAVAPGATTISETSGQDAVYGVAEDSEDDSGPRYVTLEVRISKRAVDKLNDLSRSTGRSVSSLVREAVRHRWRGMPYNGEHPERERAPRHRSRKVNATLRSLWRFGRHLLMLIIIAWLTYLVLSLRS